MDVPLWSTVRTVLSRVTVPVEAVPPEPGIASGVVGLGRRVVLSGVSTTGPFLVTVAVLGFVLDFLSGVLSPFVAVLDLVGLTAGASALEGQALAVASVAAVVVLVGVLTESSPGTSVGRRVEGAVEAIPAVGSVYTSFDKMSEVLLEGDADSFREVKLVEFPQSDTYALAFVTADGPASVAAATGEREMQVLFVPMAPNPVMGGYMVCVPTERVIDVEMTVQQAFQAIVTSGVAVGEPAEPDAGPAPVEPALPEVGTGER